MLDMQSLFLLAATCNEMNRVCNLESVWNLLCLRAWGPRMHSSLQLQANSLGWKRIVRELHTLEAVAWHPLKVFFEITGFLNLTYLVLVKPMKFIESEASMRCEALCMLTNACDLSREETKSITTRALHPWH